MRPIILCRRKKTVARAVSHKSKNDASDYAKEMKMNNLNQVIIEGNVVRQPEPRTGTGFSICTFPIAVNRTTKTQDGKTNEEVSFFDVDAFGNIADFSSKYATKGRGVRIVGRLKQNRWKDDDGKSHSKVKIIAEHIDYKPVAKKSQGADASESGGMSKQQKMALLQEAADAVASEQGEEMVF